ncbi:MAG: transglycosylase family protein [Candidatus Levyibacteriota bacterium]
METLRQKALNLFFTLGERVGLILIVVAFLSFFILDRTSQAFSKDTPQFIPQKTEWYNHNVAFVAASAKTEASYSVAVATVTPTPTPRIIVDPSGQDVWLRLAECESHQNWQDNTGNGYYGGLQFSQGAWQSVGGSGLPSEASRDEQIMRGKMLQAARGWSPWRNCAAKIGAL